MQEYEDLQTDERTGDTGPLVMRMKRRGWNPLNWIPRADPQPHDDEQEPVTITRRPAPEPQDNFTRQRRQIEQFTEDYQDWGKRALHTLARWVGYLLPALAVVAIGSDLGAFYSAGLGAFSSYLLSYAIESAIAALTIVLGVAAGSPERSAAHKAKLAITAGVWLLCEVGSALSLYVMASSVMSSSLSGRLWTVTLAWRVCSTVTLDLASIVILFWSGKSLQRHLSELRQKTHAVVALSDAETDIRRSFQRAALREAEDRAEMRARELRAAHLLRLDEARNQAELARLGIVESGYDNGRDYAGLPSGLPAGQSQLQNETGTAHPRQSAPHKKNLSVDLDSVLPALQRAHPNWSRAQLAKSLSVSPRTIARWQEKQRN